MDCYRIKSWMSNFEVSQNGSCKSMNWIAVPVKHDGKSYRRLMAMPNGPAIYGAWILIAAVAAKCEPRGTLLDDGEPLTAEDLFFKTGAPEALFAEALEVLSGGRIGWLEKVPLGADSEHAGSVLGADSEHAAPTVELRNKTERNKTRHPEPDSGVLKSPGSDSGNRKPSIFAKLTPEHLSDPMTVADWFLAATQREHPLLIRSQTNLLNVLATAVRCQIPGKAKKGPVAMFADLVSKCRWSELSQADEESARKLMTVDVQRAAGL